MFDRMSDLDFGASYRTNLFFLLVIVWAVGVQFLNVHPDMYQFIVLLLPVILFLGFNKDVALSIKGRIKPLPLRTILIIPLIWICLMPLKILIISIVNAIIGSGMGEMISETAPDPAWYLFLTVAVTPAICEEFLMRGIVYDGYKKYGIHIAAVMNGILFGIMHLNIYQFSYTFVSGMVMTYLVHITGSIFASMLLHLINNGIFYIFEMIGNLFGTNHAAVVVDKGADVIETATELGGDASSVSFVEYAMLAGLAALGVFFVYKLFKKLIKIHDVDTAQFKVSNITNFRWRKVLNLPFVISVIVFAGFNVLIMYMMMKAGLS